MEVTLRQIPVFIAFADQLVGGEISKANFVVQRVQVRKSHTYTDLKKRLADILCALRQQNEFSTEKVRLWLCESKTQLLESFEQISRAKLDDNEPMDSESQKETNSGVKFPGTSLEPLVGTQMNFTENNFHGQVVFVEVASPRFAYEYEKQERVYVGQCEWCSVSKQLTAVCKCKRVRYCNEDCMERDKRFHQPQCSAQVDDQLQEVTLARAKNSKNGKVGLTNLGNTCYMNSSLQCLSNSYELTRFFLNGLFKSLVDREVKNPLGTEGRLVMAYAKTLSEMWNSDSSVVRPDMFKRILGEYAQQFQGYGQHDSHECINTVLDLLGEDLYRKGKKPYVEDNDKEGQEEEEAAFEAWNKHLLRNESVITDLFHGQFKSTVNCSKCDRVSVTFDPLMTIMLPIPAKKDKIDCFFLPYNIKDGYINHKVNFMLRGTDPVQSLRE